MLRGFVWTYELGAVEMDHVTRVVLEPDLCFPSDVCRMPTEFKRGRKGRHVHAISSAVSEHFLKLHIPFRRYWPMRGHGLDKVYPVDIRTVEDQVGQLVMLGHPYP